jgi:hypothetical protein
MRLMADTAQYHSWRAELQDDDRFGNGSDKPSLSGLQFELTLGGLPHTSSPRPLFHHIILGGMRSLVSVDGARSTSREIKE